MKPILVVSENPEFRIETRAALGRDLHRFIEARDGLAALQNAVEDRPVMIVIDDALEGFKAADLAARLAASPETSAVPVFVLSIQSLSERATQTALETTSAAPASVSKPG